MFEKHRDISKLRPVIETPIGDADFMGTEGIFVAPRTDELAKGCVLADGDVAAYFTSLNWVLELIILVEKPDYILGCTAWFTAPDILTRLAGCDLKTKTSLVLQKQEYLKDDHSTKGFHFELRQQYKALARKWSGTRLRVNPLGDLQVVPHSSEDDWAVRCTGYCLSDGYNAPRMHHKFLVFCKERDTGGEYFVQPYAVWTGSFNVTQNGSLSCENALFIKRQSIAQQYLREYCRVMANSEPLNWTSPTPNPEWKVRTEDTDNW